MALGMDMFPPTDSSKSGDDLFPTTDNVKDIKPAGSEQSLFGEQSTAPTPFGYLSERVIKQSSSKLKFGKNHRFGLVA